MNQPENHHLAEMNIARLIAAKDDPRVADFMNNLDRMNSLGKRMPGFVWLMEGDEGPERGATDLIVDESDPLMMPNISVWEDVKSLETYVYGTIHKQFYERRAEWFEVLDKLHLVMWWVPVGHRPTIAEGLEKLNHLNANGDSDVAFGWDYVKDAGLAQASRCAPMAAE